MKILLFLHELVLGGTTVNAIELAVTLRDVHGHDVAIFASPGPMLKLLNSFGIRHLPAPEARTHPCLPRIRAFRAAVRDERPDLVYVWETWALMDAYYGVHLPSGLPLLLTDMQMHVARLLPKRIPTTFGTQELVDIARARGSRKVDLLVPPVDVTRNAPHVWPAQDARARFGIGRDEIVIGTASRLVRTMKGDSLRRTIEAMATLGRQFRLRLLIAGDGTARAETQQLADAANARLGRDAVVLLGALLDPRPVYAAADVIVGMGSSALRGMAFGKPVIVVGEGGFAEILSRASAAKFAYSGMFGRADDAPGESAVQDAIRELATSPTLRAELGAFARRFVCEHYSLEVVAAQLDLACKAAVATPSPRMLTVADGIRTAAVYCRERRFMWRTGPIESMVMVDAHRTA